MTRIIVCMVVKTWLGIFIATKTINRRFIVATGLFSVVGIATSIVITGVR